MQQEDGTWPVSRRVFFFPGQDSGEYTQPTANVFCAAHLCDIQIFRGKQFPTRFHKLAPVIKVMGTKNVSKKTKRSLSADTNPQKKHAAAAKPSF